MHFFKEHTHKNVFLCLFYFLAYVFPILWHIPIYSIQKKHFSQVCQSNSALRFFSNYRNKLWKKNLRKWRTKKIYFIFPVSIYLLINPLHCIFFLQEGDKNRFLRKVFNKLSVRIKAVDVFRNNKYKTE